MASKSCRPSMVLTFIAGPATSRSGSKAAPAGDLLHLIIAPRSDAPICTEQSPAVRSTGSYGQAARNGPSFTAGFLTRTQVSRSVCRAAVWHRAGCWPRLARVPNRANQSPLSLMPLALGGLLFFSVELASLATSLTRVAGLLAALCGFGFLSFRIRTSSALFHCCVFARPSQIVPH
jgi:hypothetical protein